ncbi:DUF4405 domain-containing protein [Butyrivibrio sp. M55]|uniref:DUF4405 domain-containing protein n=1 Tax=Butyrivibrio sp. M55 TaxID=1855323 RepID=UPI0008EDCB05|nr:DUF4405 domain-containing protein [Butyrivibrio sp. M55]SFU43816.1 protein of unknown function [Butyrivibrio sp. M55]
MKKKTRIIIDIAMICLLMMLMSYSLIGEKLHEIIGTAIFILFIVHHVMNRKWYTALLKGKWTSLRIFQTGLNLLLTVLMILQPVSGILMSKHLYTFLPVLPISAKAREIHMLFAYWGFVLMGIHIGIHLTGPVDRLKRNSKGMWITVISIITAISIYGVFAFIKRGFPGYMFMKTMFAFFDYNEPRIYFFADYMAVMVLFVMAGTLAWTFLSILEKNRGNIGNEN